MRSKHLIGLWRLLLLLLLASRDHLLQFIRLHKYRRPLHRHGSRRSLSIKVDHSFMPLLSEWKALTITAHPAD